MKVAIKFSREVTKKILDKDTELDEVTEEIQKLQAKFVFFPNDVEA